MLAVDAGTTDAAIDLGVAFVQLGYQRALADGTDARAVRFSTASPDPVFAISSATPWPSLRMLVGGYSPHATGADWPEDGPQRYVSTNALIATYNLVAGVGWSVTPDLSFAALAGPAYTYLHLENSNDFAVTLNRAANAEVLPYETTLLEGHTTVDAQGWSAVGIFGAFWKPTPTLRLGLGVVIASTPHLVGDLDVEAPADLEASLPGFELAPQGRVRIDYPMPWEVNSEAEWQLGPWTLAPSFKFARKSRQRVVHVAITESDSELLHGRQLSVKGTHDDWAVGLRLSRVFSQAWSAGVRVEYDPRYVPDEAMTPINLDYTRLALGAGVAWRRSAREQVSLAFTYVHLASMDVSTSLYTARATGNSGLALPASNGRYWGGAQVLSLSWIRSW